MGDGIIEITSTTRFGLLFCVCTTNLEQLHPGWIIISINIFVFFSYANSPLTHIRYCRLLITTVNFDCSNHCNNVNNVSGLVNKELICKLKDVVNDDDVRGDLKECADMSLDFLYSWGVSVPTTCCYQNLVDSNIQDLGVEVIQFFCLTGLGICY